MSTAKICVIGAGVIGLSSAVRIQDRFPNIDITLIADKFSPNTTSDGAGALFIIFKLEESPEDLIQKWSTGTLEHFKFLAYSTEASDARIQSVSGYNVGDGTEPEMHSELPSRRVTKEEMKLFPHARWGHFFTTFMVDCTSYLPWLMKRFTERGGKLVQKKLETLSQLYQDYDVVINCSGLRSSQLIHDPDITAARGETVRVFAPWIKHFYVQEVGGELTYILPGSKNVVLGGTFEQDNWDQASNKVTQAKILERCHKILPSLKEAPVDYSWVGLRPTRRCVRLERDLTQPHRRCQVIHNYGHGGSGVTLHWGCAGDVVNLLQESINNIKTYSKL